MYDFLFPDVGEGVQEGLVLQLKKKPGDKVEEGDILAVVETDKVVAEIPTPKSGILKEYLIEEGQVIQVGSVLAKIDISGDDDSDHELVEEENAGVVGALELAKGAVLPASGEGMTASSKEDLSLIPGKRKVLASPVARKVAADKGINLKDVKGTGPAGRVMKQDVLNFVQEQSHSSSGTELGATITPPRESTEQIAPMQKRAQQTTEELSTMRKTIATNLEQSQQIPVALIQDYAVIDNLVQLRERLKQNGNRISYQAFFIKALAAALKKFNKLNSSFDKEKQSIHYFSEVNIGVAVDTEQGLLVPVIRNADSKSIVEINNDIASLSEKAKSRKISLEDLRGATASVTNYGAFGGTYGLPMIPPGQTVIAGFGRIHKAPEVVNNEIVPAWILPVSLPFDHRVVDGAYAAQFLTFFLESLHHPENLLIELH